MVEFNQPNLPPVHDPVEKSYQITSPELFEQVVTIRDRAGKWRGEADVLDTLRLKLEAIIKHNKEFAPAYQTLAKVLIRSAMVNSSFYRRDVLGVAEKHLYQAIQLNPDYGKAFVTMANLLTKARRYDEAKSALLNAATMNVDETTLHLNWGLWRQKQNHKTLAIDHFRVVLDLSSQDSREYQSALGSLAFLYARQENFVKASTHYQALIALRPDDAWTKGNYGFYLFNYEQNIDGAIDFLEQALSIRDYGMARSHLALALYTKWATINELPESSDEAKTYFDQAYSLNPNIKYVISELSRKNHTQQAANALQKWFIQNSHNLPKANVTNTTI